MKKQTSRNIVLTSREEASLAKVLRRVHDLLSALPTSAGDLLGGEDHYRALCMWEDLFAGRKYDLSWYIDEEDEEPEPPEMTVRRWLEMYGKGGLK